MREANTGSGRRRLSIISRITGHRFGGDCLHGRSPIFTVESMMEKCCVCNLKEQDCVCETGTWKSDKAFIQVSRGERSRVLFVGDNDDEDDWERGDSHDRAATFPRGDAEREDVAWMLIQAGMFLRGLRPDEMGGLRPGQNGGSKTHINDENGGVFKERKEDPKGREGKTPRGLRGRKERDDEGIKTPSHLTGQTKSVLLQGGIPTDWVRYFDAMPGYARTLNNPFSGDAVGLARSYMRKSGTEPRFQQWLANHPVVKP